MSRMVNYGKESVFSSFLPGIAGVKGIPIWCYYVNRGQGVVSFGVNNKDHAIMEFSPAHVAYQTVKRNGFRTFVRTDKVVFEAFSKEANEHYMEIEKNTLSIKEENKDGKFTTEVTYYTLPEERVGALVRMVTITNTDGVAREFEILDGMPAVIPYGVGLDSVKNMTQTAKAWMQAEDMDRNVPYYRVRVSMDDTASVSDVLGGNFSFAVLEDGEKLVPIIDSEVIFDYDTAMGNAVVFEEEGLDGVYARKQNSSNLFPCSFYGFKKTLAAGEAVTFCEVVGQVENKELLNEFLGKNPNLAFFLDKKARATELVEELCQSVDTHTGNATFDEYCRYTYMDNVLRGGKPMQLGNNKIFYVYSRKHGDIERDYNYFAMLPEFYSQGNGNFRDVNQNRRLDTFFSPFVARENIHTFYSFIQLDGYNPLGVEKITYTISEEKARTILAELPQEKADEVVALVTKPYTPGSLFAILPQEELCLSIIDFSESLVNGNFGEGYWSDHWTYNLDLVEEYLAVFPEKEKEMLEEEAYSFFLSQANINRRFKRYEKTEKGLRQYYALNKETMRKTEDKLVRANYGKGEILYGTLLERLLLLCTTKYAALDPYGMGVEMEGGKPGWYDALNGLPGLFGSSMAETYELARMMDYVILVLKRYPGKVKLLKELACFMEELHLVTNLEEETLRTGAEVLSFWNKINDVKELYREKVYEGVSGLRTEVGTETLLEMLQKFRAVVEIGMEKAMRYGNGICPTYFSYEVVRFCEKDGGYEPLEFNVKPVPHFLEGPVRYLKLSNSKERKLELYKKVKESDLYDTKLSMYKVNASLEQASYELGRCRAFTPGWLENESIWLHMEYKYLLELLRSGLYSEFAEDFKNAAIPFLDPKVYGRSTLENSSFIASSKNPNEKIHGKGFVARLSGSTIEFLSMWKHMMFGPKPFYMEGDELRCSLTPMIPKYLIGEDKKVSAMFLGNTMVEYVVDSIDDYFPGNYVCDSVSVSYCNRTVISQQSNVFGNAVSEDLRQGKIEKIQIHLKK